MPSMSDHRGRQGGRGPPSYNVLTGDFVFQFFGILKAFN
jgi:hypothetical protein